MVGMTARLCFGQALFGVDLQLMMKATVLGWTVGQSCAE
jgi:hypothetical protein